MIVVMHELAIAICASCATGCPTGNSAPTTCAAARHQPHAARMARATNSPGLVIRFGLFLPLDRRNYPALQARAD